jgi:site-specific recombinase XerD
MPKLKKRPDGRYTKWITVSAPDGTSRRKSIYGYTLKELEDNVSIASESANSADSRQCVTVANWAASWLKTHESNIEYNTWYMYNSVISVHIIPLIGNLSLRDVQISHIQNLIDRRVAEGHSRTAQKIYITLHQIFESARVNKYISENPVIDVKKPKYQSSQKRAFTDEEKAIIKNAPLQIQQKAFLFMLLRTGMRIGEIVALNRSDIDTRSNIIIVDKSICYEGSAPKLKKPKSKSGIRKMPLSDDLRSVMLEYSLYRGGDTSDVLFPDKSGRHMTKSCCRSFWLSLLKQLRKSGLSASDITPHMFRHNFTTELVRSGLDIKTVQQIIGHASAVVTLDIYAHETDAAIDAARIRLNNQVVKHVVSTL